MVELEDDRDLPRIQDVVNLRRHCVFERSVEKRPFGVQEPTRRSESL
jgi:hypothetical protein